MQVNTQTMHKCRLLHMHLKGTQALFLSRPFPAQKHTYTYAHTVMQLQTQTHTLVLFTHSLCVPWCFLCTFYSCSVLHTMCTRTHTLMQDNWCPPSCSPAVTHKWDLLFAECICSVREQLRGNGRKKENIKQMYDMVVIMWLTKDYQGDTVERLSK